MVTEPLRKLVSSNISIYMFLTQKPISLCKVSLLIVLSPGFCLHTQSFLVAGRNNFGLQSSWQLIKKIVEQGIYPVGSSSRKFKFNSLKFLLAFIHKYLPSKLNGRRLRGATRIKDILTFSSVLAPYFTLYFFVCLQRRTMLLWKRAFIKSCSKKTLLQKFGQNHSISFPFIKMSALTLNLRRINYFSKIIFSYLNTHFLACHRHSDAQCLVSHVLRPVSRTKSFIICHHLLFVFLMPFLGRRRFRPSDTSLS